MRDGRPLLVRAVRRAMSALGATHLLNDALYGASVRGVARVAIEVVDSISHDPEAFTQGLAWHEGRLYEGTGLVGHSEVRELDPGSGAVLRQRSLDGDFAEGIAVLGDRLYQLTWRTGLCHLYRLPMLEPAGSLRFEGEGWGLASDGDRLFMSDGTSRICVRDEGLRLTGEFRATSRGIPIRNLNDLEIVNGKLFANSLDRPEILELCADTGRLLRVVDCRGLLHAEAPRHPEHVLNGIAFRAEDSRLLVTGKCWKRIYVASLPPELEAS